jgi:hypothetical protein
MPRKTVRPPNNYSITDLWKGDKTSAVMQAKLESKKQRIKEKHDGEMEARRSLQEESKP